MEANHHDPDWIAALECFVMKTDAQRGDQMSGMSLRRRKGMRFASLIGVAGVVFCLVLHLNRWDAEPEVHPLPYDLARILAGMAVSQIIYISLAPLMTYWPQSDRILVTFPLFLFAMPVSWLIEFLIQLGMDPKLGLLIPLVLFTGSFLYESGCKVSCNSEGLLSRSGFPFRRQSKIAWNSVERVLLGGIHFEDNGQSQGLLVVNGGEKSISVSSILLKWEDGFQDYVIRMSEPSATMWMKEQIRRDGSVELGAIQLYPSQVTWKRSRATRLFGTERFWLHLYTLGIFSVLDRIASLMAPSSSWMLDQIEIVEGRLCIGGDTVIPLLDVPNAVYLPKFAGNLIQEMYLLRGQQSQR